MTVSVAAETRIGRRSALLPVMLFAVSVQAQPADFASAWSGFWTVSFGGSMANSGLVERLPDDVIWIDDAGGGELAAGEYSGLRLSERALEQVRNYEFADEFLPENACRAPSVAFYMQAPFPMELYAGRDLIVFRMEYFDLFRVIFMDGRDHPPASAPHTLSGHSVGRWEGDTLVVETTGLNGESWLDRAGNFASANARITERFTPEGRNHIRYEAMIDDPDTFERPWSIGLMLYRDLEQDTIRLEFQCVEFAEELMYGHLSKSAAQADGGSDDE